MDASNLSRRRFLQTSGALLLGAASLQSRLAQAQQDIDTLFTAPGGNIDWQRVRQQFTFTDDAVPMNAANLCPSFRVVAEHVSAMTADIDKDCSFNNRARFADFLEDARNRVADQLNVSADEVALVRNTSEANNIINNGLSLERGDEVIVWDENHPTNHVAWQVRAARYGFTLTVIPTPVDVTAEQLVDAFVSQFSDRTRVLALTHVSNVSGIKLPVAELVAAAHARGIFVHLDGAQTWGAMDLDLRALGVDAYTASAHKWFMGPKEVGLLYVREPVQARIWPGVVASGWGSGVETRQRGARKFESLGQRDDAALAALGLTARIHDNIGLMRTEQRIVALSQRLKSGVQALGIPLVTPYEPSLSFGVCIVAVADGGAGGLANRLYAEHGIAGAGTGGLRLCPGIYNTEEHVDRAIAGIKELWQV